MRVEWDEVFEDAVYSWKGRREELRTCFYDKTDDSALFTDWTARELMDFAERIASLVAAAERDECAKFLERGVDLAGLARSPDMQRFTAELLLGCAKAIRARGDA